MALQALALREDGIAFSHEETRPRSRHEHADRGQLLMHYVPASCKLWQTCSGIDRNYHAVHGLVNPSLHAHASCANLQYPDLPPHRPVVVQFTIEAAMHGQGWALWLAKYACLFLQCAEKYSAALAASASAADAAAAEQLPADAACLPCIRLMADVTFVSKLHGVSHACASPCRTICSCIDDALWPGMLAGMVCP